MDISPIINLGDGMRGEEIFDRANNDILKIEFYGKEMWIVRRKPGEEKIEIGGKIYTKNELEKIILEKISTMEDEKLVIAIEKSPEPKG